MTWVPSFLASYVNIRKVTSSDVLTHCDEWVLDSGAYSALTSGVKIDLQKYIDDCHALLAGPRPPSVIFALDVIGDPEKSARNADEMRRQGINALATFHYGSPWHYIKDVVKPGRCAFGGLVARGKGGHGTKLTFTKRLAFLEQCFARAWPVWAHGFGCCDARLLAAVPLASADATSWIYALSRYGAFQYLGLNNTGIRPASNREAFASGVNGQITYYRRMEEEAQARWATLLERQGYGRFRLRYVVSSKADSVHFSRYLAREKAGAPA